MTNWFTVFQYEFMQQVTRKAFLFTTFGIPLIAALILGVYLFVRDIRANGDEPEEETIQTEFKDEDKIGYVDFAGYFTAPGADSPFKDLVIAYPNEAEGQAALEKEDIGSLYVIEADYFENGSVTQWLRTFNIGGLDSSNLMESYLLYSMAGDLQPEVIARLRAPVAEFKEQRITADTAEESSSDVDFAQIYVFALLMMFASYGSSGYLMMSVVTEKESKTLEIILTSVKPFPLLLGKVIAMGLIGFITVSVWLVALMLLSQQAAQQIVDLSSLEVKTSTVIIAIIYFFLGYGFVGGVFASLGAITNTMREGSTLAGWMVFPFVIPLFFLQAFVENPDGTAPVVLSLIPFTAPLSMVMRSAISDVPLWQLAVSISLMLVLVYASIWMASRLFRVGTLLRGSTPKLRELPGLFLRG